MAAEPAALPAALRAVRAHTIAGLLVVIAGALLSAHDVVAGPFLAALLVISAIKIWRHRRFGSKGPRALAMARRVVTSQRFPDFDVAIARQQPGKRVVPGATIRPSQLNAQDVIVTFPCLVQQEPMFGSGIAMQDRLAKRRFVPHGIKNIPQQLEKLFALSGHNPKLNDVGDRHGGPLRPG